MQYIPRHEQLILQEWRVQGRYSSSTIQKICNQASLLALSCRLHRQSFLCHYLPADNNTLRSRPTIPKSQEFCVITEPNK